MPRPYLRWAAALCGAAILLYLALGPVDIEAKPPPQKGCSASYTRADYHRAARKAFKAAPYTAHEKRTLRRVIYCTGYAKSVPILRHHHRRYLAAYWVKVLGPNRALGYRMLNNPGQWPCLDRLWHHESNWSVTADNPTSDAYGIPQALPGWKMGPGWQSSARVQIRWGIGYIAGRYGSPCRALAAWQSRRPHWY